MESKQIQILYLTVLSFSYGLFLMSIEPMNIHIQPLTSQYLLLIYIHSCINYFLPLFCYINFKIQISQLQKIFDYKIFISVTLILLTFISFGLPILWSYASFIEWIILFNILLFLFQKRKLDNFSSCILAYLSVFLASAIYEIPIIIQQNWLKFNLISYYTVTIFTFSYLLYHFKFQPSKLLFIVFIPILVEWIFYSPISLYSWLPRLFTFSLFISLAFKIGEKII